MRCVPCLPIEKENEDGSQSEETAASGHKSVYSVSMGSKVQGVSILAVPNDIRALTPDMIRLC
jgi:hypothetical protein